MSPAHSAVIDLEAVAAALAELGPERATSSELARAAGVAKPTLYAHFGSRDGILEACVQREAERLLDHIHAHADPGVALAAYAGESAGWALVLLSRHRVAVATRARIAGRIATGRDGASGLSPPLAARAFLAAAPVVLALEKPDARESSLRALALALVPVAEADE